MKVSISVVSLPEDRGRRLQLGVIEAHLVALSVGQDLAPIQVSARNDGHFDLFDGRHRFVAAVIAGLDELDAELVA